MVMEKEAEVTEVTQAIEPSLDELKQKMVGLETELESAKKEAKSHQEYGRKQREELERQRGLDEKVSRLEDTQKVVAEMLADLIDRNADTEEEEKPKQRRSDAYRTKIDETQGQEQKRVTQRVREMALEADRLLKSVGFDMETSPEALKSYNLFLLGKPESGLEEVKRMVESKKTEAAKPKETPEQIGERLAKEMFNKMLKDKGLDVVDDGVPSSGSARFEEVRDKYIENPGDVKNTIEYYRLRQERGI